MLKRIAAAALVSAAVGLTAVIPSAASAKSCLRGYTHAVIGGKQKCLHAGEFCARRYQREYLHYRFTCDDYVDGEWHLERR
jgi:hypothetical protein